MALSSNEPNAPSRDDDSTHHLHLPTVVRHADGRIEITLSRRDYQHVVTALGLEGLAAGRPEGAGANGSRALALARVLVGALPTAAQDEVRETCRLLRRMRRSA
ncbi:hypothetical protein [Gemmatimonas sp.]|jgi:hypothetical protein|uniref:hypothetical protein n=1 Tax=Gemmatimonas sp. TaxID=1962908 RepID=UPI003F719243